MTDPAERFIEAAVRPLEDNAELQMMAAQELRAAIEGRPDGSTGDSFEQAAENLQKAPKKEPWKVILYSLAAVAAIFAAVPVARDYIRLRLASWEGVPGQFGPMTASERLLLFGDPSQRRRSERLERLWASDRGNPALFAIYARACASERKLPADLLQTADRIDPQNAWFRYLAAGMKSYKSVEAIKVPYRFLKRNPNTPRFRVVDPAAYAEALRLFEEAARLPKAKSFKKELLLRRLAILPPGDDVLGRKLATDYLEFAEPYVAWTGRELSPAIGARAEELAAAGDREGFMKLAEAWEIFARRWIEDDSLAASSLNPAPHLARAARILGLEAHAARYSRLEAAIKKRISDQELRTARFKEHWVDLDRADAKLLSAGTKVENPPVIGRSDLMPGQMAFHEMCRRVASAAAGLVVLAALLLAAGGRFMRGRQARSLSATLVKVLRPSDYTLILLGGVVAPFLAHVLAEWMLSAFASTSTKDALSSTFLRFEALAMAILVLPALLTAKQLSLRLGCLGWPRPPAYTIHASIVVALLAVVAGCTRSETAHVLGWAFVIVPIAVVFLALTIAILFNPRADVVRSFAWTRGLLPAYATGLLLLALLVPFHHSREKHWTNLNVLTKIEPGIPAMNRYEHEIENQVRQDLLELLDAKP